MANYNGKIQNVRRRYDSIRNFVGKNEVHKAGDILCVSPKNDDDYTLFLHADGKSTFLQLLKKAVTPSEIGPNTVGSKQIINDSVKLEDLDPEIRALLEELDSYEVLTPEEAKDKVDDIISQLDPDYHPTQEAGAGEDTVEGGGADLD